MLLILTGWLSVSSGFNQEEQIETAWYMYQMDRIFKSVVCQRLHRVLAKTTFS